jgi:hypothetical protein
MDFHNERKLIGHPDQLIKAKRIRLQEGKASGVEMIDIQNRSGLHFDVNVSRGMDIPYLDFCGENFGFISPCGVVAPEYFDDKELGFLKSFTAGFLTTCGLQSAGAPSEYEGKAYGLHGNLSHTPAEEVTCTVEMGDNPCVVITGKVRDASIFGDKLMLEREIRCYYKERKFSLHDRVKNEGYKKTRHMILYHCNMGYPLLSPESELFIPALETKARNEHAQTGIDSWNKAQAPDPDYEEMCYYHTLKADENNQTAVALYNHDLSMGIAIEFGKDTLDHLVQWKMMGAGDYVMGLEPANSTIDGIEDAIKNGSMKYLEPEETVDYHITFRVLTTNEEFEELKNKFE